MPRKYKRPKYYRQTSQIFYEGWRCRFFVLFVMPSKTKILRTKRLLVSSTPLSRKCFYVFLCKQIDKCYHLIGWLIWIPQSLYPFIIHYQNSPRLLVFLLVLSSWPTFFLYPCTHVRFINNVIRINKIIIKKY